MSKEMIKEALIGTAIGAGLFILLASGAGIWALCLALVCLVGWVGWLLKKKEE